MCLCLIFPAAVLRPAGGLAAVLGRGGGPASGTARVPAAAGAILGLVLILLTRDGVFFRLVPPRDCVFARTLTGIARLDDQKGWYSFPSPSESEWRAADRRRCRGVRPCARRVRRGTMQTDTGVVLCVYYRTGRVGPRMLSRADPRSGRTSRSGHCFFSSRAPARGGAPNLCPSRHICWTPSWR